MKWFYTYMHAYIHMNIYLKKTPKYIGIHTYYCISRLSHSIFVENFAVTFSFLYSQIVNITFPCFIRLPVFLISLYVHNLYTESIYTFNFYNVHNLANNVFWKPFFQSLSEDGKNDFLKTLLCKL